MPRVETEVCPQVQTELEIQKCNTCGRCCSTSRRSCVCGSSNLSEPKKPSGKGTVYSYTTIYDPPAGFEGQKPHTVVLVKMEEGNLVPGSLTDCNLKELKIGMPVEKVIRKTGQEGKYAGAFRPPIQPKQTERMPPLFGSNGKGI